MVKFQAAFYEAYGPEGVSGVACDRPNTARVGRLDRSSWTVERNDIGSTAEAYARAYLGKVPVGDHFEPSWDVDALTINPYLGIDGISSVRQGGDTRGKRDFRPRADQQRFGSGNSKTLIADGKPIYRHVAERLAGWALPHRGDSGYSFVGAVVGATYRFRTGRTS